MFLKYLELIGTCCQLRYSSTLDVTDVVGEIGRRERGMKSREHVTTVHLEIYLFFKNSPSKIYM